MCLCFPSPACARQGCEPSRTRMWQLSTGFASQLTPNYLPHQGSLSGKLQPPGRGELDSSEPISGCANTTQETWVQRAGETQLQGWQEIPVPWRGSQGFLGPGLQTVQQLLRTERAARGERFWKLPGVGVMGEVLALGFHHLPIAWKPFECLLKGIAN